MYIHNHFPNYFIPINNNVNKVGRKTHRKRILISSILLAICQSILMVARLKTGELYLDDSIYITPAFIYVNDIEVKPVVHKDMRKIL